MYTLRRKAETGLWRLHQNRPLCNLAYNLHVHGCRLQWSRLRSPLRKKPLLISKKPLSGHEVKVRPTAGVGASELWGFGEPQNPRINASSVKVGASFRWLQEVADVEGLQSGFECAHVHARILPDVRISDNKQDCTCILLTQLSYLLLE